MSLKKVAFLLDRVAQNLHKRDLPEHSRRLCMVRDMVLREANVRDNSGLTKHAVSLDALARKAHKMGLGDIASELCTIRDSIQATAMDGPDGFKPVNCGEEGYPEDSESEVAVPEAGKVTTGPQNSSHPQKK